MASRVLFWIIERYLGEFLDRSRLKATAALHEGALSLHVENSGERQTSINGAGYVTTDGVAFDLRWKEALPTPLPGRSELILHARNFLDLPLAAVKLRREGKAIPGAARRPLTGA